MNLRYVDIFFQLTIFIFQLKVVTSPYPRLRSAGADIFIYPRYLTFYLQ